MLGLTGSRGKSIVKDLPFVNGKSVSDLPYVVGFLRILRFPPPGKLTFHHHHRLDMTLVVADAEAFSSTEPTIPFVNAIKDLGPASFMNLYPCVIFGRFNVNSNHKHWTCTSTVRSYIFLAKQSVNDGLKRGLRVEWSAEIKQTSTRMGEMLEVV